MFSFKPENWRKDFPILEKPIIYFDNACMSLKPKQVIETMQEYYSEYTACAGRSAHRFAQQVETEVVKSRHSVKKLIHAKYDSEVIFTRNTTEGINLLARSFPLQNGDEVIISDKEHNSNMVPWIYLMKEKGIKLQVVQSKKDNTFDLEHFEKLLNKRTKLVSLVHTSNLDGVTNPIKEIVKLTHEGNALCHLDGAQSVPGKEVDVKNLDVDFFSFSGHKMLGPTGTGVFYGKQKLLEELPQFMVGGETVLDATYDSFVPEKVPAKFEAGLQDYAGIMGLGAASRYLQRVGLDKIAQHEIALNKMLTESLLGQSKLSLIGPEDPLLRSGIFSFIVDGMDSHHVSGILDASKKILTRSGAHCVHGWFNKHKLKGSVRVSLYFYNTEEEVQIFIEEMFKLLQV